MAAIAEGRRGEAPVAIVAHRGAANHRTAIGDNHHTASFAAAAQGWRSDVSAACAQRIAVIVGQLDACRCRGRDGVDGDGDYRRIRHRAAAVIGAGAECVGAVGQRRWREAPLSVAARDHAAQNRAAVVQGDEIARPGLAAENRRAVGGAVVIGQFDQRAAVIIGDNQQAAGGRHARLDVDREHRRCRADVAGRVSHRGGQAVLPIGERIWRKAPAAVAAGGNATEQRGAVIDTHHRARFCRTAQGWRAIVGGLAGSQRAGGAARVIRHLQAADGGRRGGVNTKGDRR